MGTGYIGQRIPCFDSCQLNITWMYQRCIRDVPMVEVLLVHFSWPVPGSRSAGLGLAWRRPMNERTDGRVTPKSF